jgi:hypothetical protein
MERLVLRGIKLMIEGESCRVGLSAFHRFAAPTPAAQGLSTVPPHAEWAIIRCCKRGFAAINRDLVVMDHKLAGKNEGGVEEIVANWAPQLASYAAAIARVSGKPPTETCVNLPLEGRVVRVGGERHFMSHPLGGKRYWTRARILAWISFIDRPGRLPILRACRAFQSRLFS